MPRRSPKGGSSAEFRIGQYLLASGLVDYQQDRAGILAGIISVDLVRLPRALNDSVMPSCFQCLRSIHSSCQPWVVAGGIASADLSRGGGGNVPGVGALDPCAFPCLNLSRLVHFGQVKCPSTNRTRSRRESRGIKLAISIVRVAVPVAEDAMTVAPFALVERPSFVRASSLQHDSSHRAMVQIAQRGEFHLWMTVHGPP
jgi:hypothetical protein